MANGRFKDVEWNLSNAEGRISSWEHVQCALLMDIRDQLQELNRTLGCYRVRQGMDSLHRLEKRAAKHWPLGPGRKK